MQHFIIGVDEAGRGPLAGPVSVGAAVVPHDFNWSLIPGVNDSKKLSEKKREAIFLRAQTLKKEGVLDLAVAMVSAKIIDRDGINSAISSAIKRSLFRIVYKNKFIGAMMNQSTNDVSDIYEKVYIKLDGGLKASSKYINQETIIKGDAKEKIIGLASIIAKVTRDRYMVQKSTKSIFTPYTFAIHKGYGTKVHREAIEKYGPSAEHRLTFCKNILS